MHHLPPMPGSGLFPSFPPRWMPSIGLPHWWDYAWWTIVLLLIGGLWRVFTYLGIQVDLDNPPSKAAPWETGISDTGKIDA